MGVHESLESLVDGLLEEVSTLAGSSSEPEKVVLKMIIVAGEIVQSCRSSRLQKSVDEPRLKKIAEPSLPTLGLNRTFRLAKKAYDARRARDPIFLDDGLFAEPAWDIMLDLLVAENQHKPISVTSACIASGVPATTALRWIALLEDRGYIERQDDRADGRRSYLFLTEKARSLLYHYFLELDRLGLA